MGFDTKTKHSIHESEIKVSPIMVFLKHIFHRIITENSIRSMTVMCTPPRRRISFKEKVMHCMFIGMTILATPVIFFAKLGQIKPSESEEEQKH